MKIDIKPIKEFYTLFHHTKKEKIASIIFPSVMEASLSRSKCSVDFRTGVLEANTNDSLTLNDNTRTLYITDATVLEMNDCYYRVAASRNYAYLNTLSFDNKVVWSFSKALQDWANALPKEYTKCRMFGGDLIKTAMLGSIYDAFESIPDKTFYLHTSRRDILHDSIDKNMEKPDNVFIYNRCLENESIEIGSFPNLYIYLKNGYASDLDTYPTDSCDIPISLGESNETMLRSKTPWFDLKNGN